MTIPTADPPVQPHVSVAVAGADGALLHQDDADRPFYAASTIKLHVLLAVLRAADEGQLDLEQVETSRRSFTGVDGSPFTLQGDHLDATHPAEGEPITVRELAVRMIDRSSNEATDHLLELVGLEAVTSVIEDLGLTSTRVERLIGDAVAIEQGLTNETSAADLVRTVWAMVADDDPASLGLSDAARGLTRDALIAQRITIIAKAVRSGVLVGSKSGWVDGYRHDVAFIGDPHSQDVRYMAVMTSGIALAEADEIIGDKVRERLPDVAV